MPNNGATTGATYGVRIDGGNGAASTVTLSSLNKVTIDWLQVDAGDALSLSGDLSSGAALTLASLTNVGTITLNSTNTASTLLFSSSAVSIGGGGTFVLSGGTLGPATSLSSVALTNAVDVARRTDGVVRDRGRIAVVGAGR